MNILKSLLIALTISSAMVACKSKTETAEGFSNAKLTGNYPTTGEVKWEGKGVGHGHNGTVNISSSELTFADGALVGGHVEVDMKSIKSTDIPADSTTLQAKLIGHLMNKDFFAVDSFPTASIKINSVTNNEVTADMTIRGITNTIKFPITVIEDSTGFTANSTLSIDRTLFGIQYSSAKFFDIKKLGNYMVEDEIKLDVTLKGVK